MSGMEARSRKWDPWTSHSAAHGVEKTGAANGQRAAILHYVLHHPGETASEIAQALGIGEGGHKRLPELRDAGFLINGPARTCRVRGTKAMTWIAVDNGSEVHVQRDMFGGDQ